MRITSFELAPYGHLSYARLDLSAPAGGPGLHVIRGRNGAGKSTTMRALDAALFGIPRRTRDAHTHPGPALKIGLAIETDDGRNFTFERRKRDGQSLFAPDGSPVDEALLREALGGLPPEEYRAMFLLDCEKLEQGSADLLAGRGLLGQALFGAALGFGRVHTLLAELENDAAALWVKGGTRTLTRQIKELGEARKHKRQDRLDADELARLGTEREEAETELAELKETLDQVTERLDRTMRHQRCMAPLARRAHLSEKLAALAGAPLLPAAFAEQVHGAQADLEQAHERITETEEELGAVTAELDANPEPGPIVDHDREINALYRRAGEIDKATSDLARRDAELAACEGDIERLLARARPLRIESVDELGTSDADRARVDELASERAKLDQAYEDATQAVTRLGSRLQRVKAATPAEPAMSERAQAALSDAIDAARAEGDLDAAAHRARQQAREYRQAAARAGQGLPQWEGTVDALQRLAVPTAATIRRFEREQSELDQAARRLDERSQELARRRAALDREEAALTAGPQAPTRAEVSTVRQVRDDALTALINAPDGGRVSALRRNIRSADDLADARTDHAEIAVRRDRLGGDRVVLKQDVQQLRDDREAHAGQAATFAERWADAWPDLPGGPRTPEEMREWLELRAEIVGALQSANAHESGAAEAEEAIAAHRRSILAAAGGGLGPDYEQASLRAVLREASALLAEAVDARSARAEHERECAGLEEELDDARRRLRRAGRALETWAQSWKPVVEALGLEPEATPTQARAQLGVIEELIAVSENATRLRRRVTAIREDAAEFRREACALATTLAPELAQSEPSMIAEALHARAAAARSARAARQHLQPQQRKLSRRLAAAQERHSEAVGRLVALAQRAGVDVEGLDALCETIEERCRLEDELREAESELVTLGAGRIEDLAAELAEATLESLARLRADDEAEVAGLEQRRSELERQLGALREKLRAGGGDSAALAAEQEAHARAAIVDGVERYAELSLAIELLRAAIERHRQQHQGPLLKRAGELFAQLSAGVMSGLTIATTTRDPYIMGVLADAREVPVEGMSAGQRHQLFLALRLASLERHFEHSEPMPLILDDLLVQLDDVSARASLEILAQLSQTVQVLFFTHHDHLVTMARETVPAELLVEHEVGETNRPALRAA